MGQSRKDITGRVVDDANNPIGGITVTVKNGNTATSTNADGSFGIKANIGNILIFTSVGYETVEVAISSTESLIIVLNEKKEILSDVVVIGYGKGSKKLYQVPLPALSQRIKQGYLQAILGNCCCKERLQVLILQQVETPTGRPQLHRGHSTIKLGGPFM